MSPKQKRGNYCCVVNCHNSRANTKGSTPPVKFYRFPNRWYEKSRRQEWIKAVRRENADGSVWLPKAWTIICSRHFVGNCKNDSSLHPSYVPTVFPAAYKKRAPHAETAQRSILIPCCASVAYDTQISDMLPVNKVANTGMVQKRCLCGQVANMDAASQVPGWKVRREVSIQCNLLPPPAPPPLISSDSGGAKSSRAWSHNDSHFLSRKAVDQHTGTTESSKKVSSSSGITDSAEKVGSCSGATDSVTKESNYSGATDNPERLGNYNGAANSVEKVSKGRGGSDGAKKVNIVIEPTTKVEWLHCELCSFTTKSKYTLRDHMLAHKGDKCIQCPICLAKFAKKHNVVRHMQQTHPDGKLYKSELCRCDLCPYKTVNKDALEKHMEIHMKGKEHTCDVCSYVASRPSLMVRHMRSHTGDKPYKCEMCTFVTAWQGTLERHVLKKHCEL